MKTKKAYWDETYHKTWAQRSYPNINIPHFTQREIAGALHKHLPKQKGLNFLELGCGSSIWLPYVYKEYGYKVSGIDYSQEGVDVTRRNLEQAGCSAPDLIVEDMFKLSSNDYAHLHGTFDVIFSLGLLEHFDDPQAVIEVGKTLLKKGGIWVAWLPNTSSFWFSLIYYIQREMYDIHKIFDLKEMIRLHKNTGLTITDAYYTQFFVAALINPEKYQRILHAGISALTCPGYLLGSALNLQSAALCSSMVVVAQKI